MIRDFVFDMLKKVRCASFREMKNRTVHQNWAMSNESTCSRMNIYIHYSCLIALATMETFGESVSPRLRRIYLKYQEKARFQRMKLHDQRFISLSIDQSLV